MQTYKQRMMRKNLKNGYEKISLAKVYAEDGAYATAADRLEEAAASFRKAQEYRNKILVEMRNPKLDVQSQTTVQRVYVEPPNKGGRYEYLERRESGIFHCVVSTNRNGNKYSEELLDTNKTEKFSEGKWELVNESLQKLYDGKFDNTPDPVNHPNNTKVQS